MDTLAISPHGITINHLGDVHHNQGMKLARAAIALAKEETANG